MTSDYKQMLITCLVFILISFVPIYYYYVINIQFLIHKYSIQLFNVIHGLSIG